MHIIEIVIAITIIKEECMLTLLKNQVSLTFYIHSKALTQIHFLNSYLCHQDFMDQKQQRQHKISSLQAVFTGTL